MDDQSCQDSESQNMPLASHLLNPLPRDVLAAQRESLYETATNLACAINVAGFTPPKIIESQLEDAIRFLDSDDTPQEQLLSDKFIHLICFVWCIERVFFVV